MLKVTLQAHVVYNPILTYWDAQDRPLLKGKICPARTQLIICLRIYEGQ